ncbi:hypothetical protein B7C52_20000 [Escherichia coli]|nr:hypothetical protein B7C52_20000 [Escherichia coli]
MRWPPGRWRKSRTRSRTRIKEVAMTTPNPLAKTKGAGTTFWMYTGKGDAFAATWAMAEITYQITYTN